jgi:hypothetical protein
MHKKSIALFLAPILVLTGLWLSAGASAKKSADDEVDDLARSSEFVAEELAERQQNRLHFLLHMEPVLDDLVRGRLSLRQASDKLILFSLQHHAEFLSNVMATERGATPLEYVARNCLRHLREINKDRKQPIRNLADLEKQLAIIIAEERSKVRYAPVPPVPRGDEL